MADVFISYKKEDFALTQMVEAALSAHQLTVWWDKELKGGQVFRQEIENQIEAAGAVVVIWTDKSVLSDFVFEEASAAKDAGKLVPVFFADNVRPPFGFREIQAHNLAGWNGDAKDPRILSLVAQIDGARRGRVGAAASLMSAAVVEAVGRRAKNSKAATSLFGALQFLDFFGLPLYRLLAGGAVLAALMTALWLVPAALQGGVSGWPVIFVAAAIAVLGARALYQVATILSGKYSRQFFDTPFSFWTVFAVIAAVAIVALNLPMAQISVVRILEAAPIYFCGVIVLLMGLRLVGAAFGKLLART